MKTNIVCRPTQIESLLLVVAAWALLIPTAFAQQLGTYSPTGTASGEDSTAVQQAGGISLGPVTAYPSFSLGLGYTDNLLQSRSNRTSDSFSVFTPSVRFEARQAANTYSVVVGSTLGVYNSSKDDDYTNYNVNGLANLDLSARLRAMLKADYIKGINPRGSTNNPISAEPDRYHQTYLGGIASYGARGARGRIDFELGQTSRRYENNRAITSTSDLDTDDIGATFFWRIMPKTSLLLQAKHSNIDYLDSASTQNSTEDRLLAGVTWEATAKTTGTFKLGMVKKSFDDPARNSSTQPSWEAGIKWSPRTYSHVDFNLSRKPAETTGGVGNFSDTTTTGAVWTHTWTSRFSTAATASYITEDYKGASREDATQNYGLKATYTMRRWLSFGADYLYTTRDSDDFSANYTRNRMLLFINATL